jgi:hypothetical protein
MRATEYILITGRNMGYIQRSAPGYWKKKLREGLIMDEAATQEQRITEILGADNLAVTLKSLTLYRDYLRKNLDPSCAMTGVEGIPWEEKYAFAFDDTADPEALKKKQPSRADIYELKRFEDLIDEVAGIFVKVKRVDDNQRFIFELASLKAVDSTSKSHALLDDYMAWFINH